MKKLNTKKYIFIMLIVFILLVFKVALEQIFTFNLEAEDLQRFNPQEVKDAIVGSHLSPQSLRSKFMFYVSFFIPILLSFIAYEYKKIKSKSIIFNIGKNNNYNKEVFSLKLKLAIFSSLIIITAFTIVMIIAFTFGSPPTKERLDSFENFYFLKESILNTVFGSYIGYLIFTIISVSVASFVNAIFLFTLVDYKGYIKGILFYLGMIWIGSMILYGYLPYYFVPMTTIMNSSYGAMTVSKIISPYYIIILIYAFIKLTNKYEVN